MINTSVPDQSKLNLFMPGRLCLFGEHSDWAGQMRKFNADILPGRALVACTQEGIHATAEAEEKLCIVSIDEQGNTVSAEYDMDITLLQAVAQTGGFFSYVAGVAAYMLNYYHIGGIRLECTSMTLPQKKGLSSSAAVCALTAQAFNRIYKLNLTIRGIMEAAYGGEQLTPSRCGRLDQAVVYGHGIVSMIFNGDMLDVSPVKIGAPLHFVFADLGVEKNTIKILSDLNKAYPYPQTEEHRNLHKLLGTINNQITGDVLEALAEGNAKRLGALMTQAQALFDRYAAPVSPIELKSPVLHRILEDANISEWTYGGKGVGSQGDGSVQFVAKSADNMIKLKEYLSNNLGLDGYSLTIPKTSAVRKAVIPLGGYGARMFPAAKVTRKEFLPIVDTDNMIKPSLLILLESVIDAGIEEVCLVIRPGEDTVYKELFSPLTEVLVQKLPDDMQRYNERIAAIGSKISFAYQSEPLGFGHAVLQSRSFAGGEPVLLMLGDHLFTSNTDKSCIAQLIDAYEHEKLLSIGLFELTIEDVPHYGVARIDVDTRKISMLAEKPSQELARSELCCDGKYYGVFMYVITEQVYDALAADFKQFNNSGELQLTPALNTVAQKYGAAGVAICGNRHDMGLPELYKQTVADYGKIKHST